ncbi:MAG TPA: outer membrane beta-barrel domain-containing protein [Steroidobacteraceae bacterium]|nr:outer membrane beta-barrel domain-containing protein [Steroidobacteraceae bacterium]
MEIRHRVLLLVLVASLTGCATVHHLFGGGSSKAQGQTSAQGSTDDSEDSTRSGAQNGPQGGAQPGNGQTAQAPATGDSENPPRVIQPEVQRRKVKVPKIRSQDLEVGGYLGTLNIEDFGAHQVYGVQAAYHVSEDFFFQAEAGRSKGGATSFEVLSGIQLLTDSERWFKYYDLSLGYNVLPGEVFLGRNVALISSLYVLAGVGGTEFAGDQKFTVNFGAGYKLLPADWIAVHVAVEDRVFNSDVIGVEKLASNLEAHIGLTFFF